MNQNDIMKSPMENREDYIEETVKSLPNELGNDLNVHKGPLHSAGLMCGLVPASSVLLKNVICRHQ